MDIAQDYYTILGIEPTDGEEAIRLAYREAARRFHPDVNKTPGAGVLFRDINTAYEILSNRERRLQYDRGSSSLRTGKPSLLLHHYTSRTRLQRLPEPQLLYVMVKIQPLLEVNLRADAPLNLCVVIDRSKSMVGQRLQHVKRAAHRIIDDCGPEDIISIVAFSDQAEVVIPAQRKTDPRSMKSMVSTIRADGATAILEGLRLGLRQLERYRSPRYVNHLVLITDGRTYGDEAECLSLADDARENGIGISGMGIGEDWNDDFLDDLASKTGGSSAYIISVETASRFLHDRIRSLATAYAERAKLIAAPATNVTLESLVRVSPNSITLPTTPQPIPLGTIDGLAVTTLMFEFHVYTEDSEPGEFFLGRVDLSGEVLGASQRTERVAKDLILELVEEPVEEAPPAELLDALSKLTMYRLQDKAREALQDGDVAEATRRLEFLATRLFEVGEESLGQAALQEAQLIAQSRSLSDEGGKRLKYGTRALMPTLGDADD